MGGAASPAGQQPQSLGGNILAWKNTKIQNPMKFPSNAKGFHIIKQDQAKKKEKKKKKKKNPSQLSGRWEWGRGEGCLSSEV